MNEDSRTLWCGNLSEKVTEELLYELFLQVAPLEKVRIPADREGRKPNFGFVTLKHEVSVDYATQMLDGTELFNRRLHVKPRHSNQNQNQRPPPVQQHQNHHNHHMQNPVENNMISNLNDLMLMGQMMQLNCVTNMNPGHNYENHHHQSYRKPYDKHNNRRDNYNNRDNNNRQGRSGHHRNHQSYNDRNRKARYY